MHERGYQIRVEGRISERWISWFEDLNIQIENDEGPVATTTMSGMLADQAALIGLLQTLYTLGLPLLSVAPHDADSGDISEPVWGEEHGPDLRPDRTKEDQTMKRNGERMETSSGEPVLVTRGLTKSYGKVPALRGVDLTVFRGEIFGFLGPNGAGKTTTIRCLLDMIRPSDGTLLVLGMDPQADPVQVQARTGYLPGELRLNDNLTAERQLRFFSDMRARNVDWGFVRELAATLALDLGKPIKNLSKGNKQKVGIVQALMHRPELLLLDEPTSGLDPLMQQSVLSLIRQANAEGATIFFSSHIMSEVQTVADRVGIIREGQIAEVAKTGSLVKRSLRRATIRFTDPVNSAPLGDLPGVTLISRADGVSVSLQIEGDMDRLVKALGAYPVSDIETEQPSLEEIFMRYYK